MVSIEMLQEGFVVNGIGIILKSGLGTPRKKRWKVGITIRMWDVTQW